MDERGAEQPGHLSGGVPRHGRQAEALPVAEHAAGDAARRQPPRDVEEDAQHTAAQQEQQPSEK